MRASEVERVFADLKSWLPGLIRDVQARQAGETVIAPQGPFAVDKQRALGRAAMELLGFDFEAGRLDESAHPFCGGVPEDVRMTTRYSWTDDAAAALIRRGARDRPRPLRAEPAA
jgi:carboxypeptidase Taq